MEEFYNYVCSCDHRICFRSLGHFLGNTMGKLDKFAFFGGCVMRIESKSMRFCSLYLFQLTIWNESLHRIKSRRHESNSLSHSLCSTIRKEIEFQHMDIYDLFLFISFYFYFDLKCNGSGLGSKSYTPKECDWVFSLLNECRRTNNANSSRYRIQLVIMQVAIDARLKSTAQPTPSE